MYTKKYDLIIKTKSQIEELGYIVENNVLKYVDVNVIGHFGNCACLELRCENIHIVANYNNTSNVGYLLKALVEFLDIEEEDGIRISKIKNIPIRIIMKEQFGQCIGFGHFMKDKFVLTEDFIKITV
jgi:hypothetical protein